MNRRHLLSLMGAAAAAPALPPAAFARVPALGKTKGLYAYALAVFHARIRPEITAADLALRLKVRPHVADQMIQRMLDEHYIVPGKDPGRFRPADPFQRQRALHHEALRQTDPLMHHLHKLARAYFAAKSEIMV